MTNHKCESCRKGFNGQNGNGYMPCGCRKAIYAKPLTPTEKSEAYQKLKDGMEVDLSKNPPYSKRNRIEPMPEFVEPPPLVPFSRPRLGWKPKSFNPDPYANFNKLLRIIMMVCLAVLSFVMGCLYAASYLS